MRVRRHDGRACRLGLLRKRADNRRNVILQGGNLPPKVEPQIQRHLLVAGAPGMQPLAQVADAFDELALDECVHILIGTVDERRLAPAPFENVVQRSRHFLRFRVLEDADSGERVDPCEAARHVVFEEPPIEAKGRPELESHGVGLTAETS